MHAISISRHWAGPIVSTEQASHPGPFDSDHPSIQPTSYSHTHSYTTSLLNKSFPYIIPHSLTLQLLPHSTSKNSPTQPAVTTPLNLQLLPHSTCNYSLTHSICIYSLTLFTYNYSFIPLILATCTAYPVLGIFSHSFRPRQLIGRKLTSGIC